MERNIFHGVLVIILLVLLIVVLLFGSTDSPEWFRKLHNIP